MDLFIHYRSIFRFIYPLSFYFRIYLSIIFLFLDLFTHYLKIFGFIYLFSFYVWIYLPIISIFLGLFNHYLSIFGSIYQLSLYFLVYLSFIFLFRRTKFKMHNAKNAFCKINVNLSFYLFTYLSSYISLSICI